MPFWVWNRDNNIVTKVFAEIEAGTLYGVIQLWSATEDGGVNTSNNPNLASGVVGRLPAKFISGSGNFIVSNTKLINTGTISANYASWPHRSGTGQQYVSSGLALYKMLDYYGNSISKVSDSYDPGFCGSRLSDIYVNPSFENFDALCEEVVSNGTSELIRIASCPIGFCFREGSGNYPSQIVPVICSGGRDIDGKYLIGFEYGGEIDIADLLTSVSGADGAWRNVSNVDFGNNQYGALSNLISQGVVTVPRVVTNSEYNSLTGGSISDNPPTPSSESSIYGPGGTTSDTYNPYPGGSSGSNPGTNDPLNSGTDTTSTSTPGTWELPFDDVPDSPSTVHSVDLGLYNVYALSAAQVKELANYLFSGVTEIGENLVKLIWGSKRDVIISLYEFPLMVTTQGTDTIRFIFDTDLAGLFHGKQLTSEYIPIDFGTIKVDRYSGTFYDFEPYTTLTLYIPYIGYVDLKPTEVVGSTLSIRGYVHLTTGELTVNVRSSRTGILGSYSGTIGRMLPIADADATDIYASIIKTAASLGAVALAGAGMATASRAVAGISTPNKQTVDSARDTYMQAVGAWGSATRGVRGREATMLQAQGSYEKAQADYAEQAGKYNTAQSAVRANREDFHDSASDAVSNSLDAVTTGFGVSRGTVMTSSNGRVSPQRCFLRIEVPHQNVSRQQKILGYPANTSDALNSDRLHGYTELRTIELSIPNATLAEIQELEDILRGGFYLP